MDYQAKIYGPYADNLRHVLKSLEGHQLEGFGDGSKKVREAEPITAPQGGANEASKALAENHLLPLELTMRVTVWGWQRWRG